MPKTLIPIAGATLMLFSAGAAHANPIDTCRENSRGKKERIVCLEAAIAQLMNPEIAANDAAPAKAALVKTETPPVPQNSAAIPPVKEAKMTARAAPTGIGAEQVINYEVEKGERKRDKKRASAVIADYSTTSTGRFLIFLDNGQIWRQLRSDNEKVRLRKNKDYAVEIVQGAISGYRMKIPGAYATIRVERIK